MTKVKARTIRIDDDIWNKALVTCESNGTTVSQVVRAYLKFYIAESIRYQERNGNKMMRTVPSPKRRKASQDPRPLSKKEQTQIYRGDPDRCYHIHVVKATFGTICLGCGSLLKPAESISRFLEILRNPGSVEWPNPPDAETDPSQPDHTTSESNPQEQA
jgi:hypothetical protein